jgi:hypothetical protein
MIFERWKIGHTIKIECVFPKVLELTADLLLDSKIEFAFRGLQKVVYEHLCTGKPRFTGEPGT